MNAPALELPDADGGTWRLADHRGRPVVLIFHRHLA
jgi:peroxiredoxin